MVRRGELSRFVIVLLAIALLAYAGIHCATYRALRGPAPDLAPAAAPAPVAPEHRPAAQPVAPVPPAAHVVVRVSSTAPGAADLAWTISASRSPLADQDLVRGRADERPGEYALDLPAPGEWTVRADGVTGELRIRFARTIVPGRGANELSWNVPDGSVRGRLRPAFPPDARVKLAGRLADGTSISATTGVAADGAFEIPFAITGRYGLALEGQRDRRTIVVVTPAGTVDAGEF